MIVLDLHNRRGDVVALYDSTGTLFATYDYDVWGKLISVKDASGNTITSDSNFAILNSIRYRGYYYTESGLYYLQSRYYDPEIGRFINADDVGYLGASDSIPNLLSPVMSLTRSMCSSKQNTAQ